MKKILKISEYTLIPGGRYISDGQYSGEDFRENYLIPFLKNNLSNQIEIDLDGTYGYGSSFLEESFGGLVRKKIFDNSFINHIEIKSNEDPSQIVRIKKYINEAQNEEI